MFWSWWSWFSWVSCYGFSIKNGTCGLVKWVSALWTEFTDPEAHWKTACAKMRPSSIQHPWFMQLKWCAVLTDADSWQKEEKKKLQQRAGKIQSITITELNLCHIHVIFMSFTSAQAPGYARPKESHNGFVQFWFFRLSQFCIVLHSSAFYIRG